MAIYEGGDITDITTENIIAVIPGPTETLITFRVHGSEGTRTYRFRVPIQELLETVGELAEFL
jgi:hypothetical protein